MKTVIVTGANSGLGLWTAKYLLDLDYQVIMACRDIEKTKNAVENFTEFNKTKSFIVKELDLGDFESIRNFVNSLSDFPAIYGLDCNAGMSYEGEYRYTKNGIEETFGTNYLGHFLLTNLLLEKYSLERIVMVSSELHNPNNKSPFAKAVFKPVDEMAHPKLVQNNKIKRQSQSFYATSKLCMILFAYELDRRLKKRNAGSCSVNAINPGLMLTTNLGRTYGWGENLYRNILNLVFKIIGIADNPKQSAKAVVKLIDGETNSGQYFDKCKVIASSKDSYDPQKASQLWEGSEQLVGTAFQY